MKHIVVFADCRTKRDLRKNDVTIGPEVAVLRLLPLNHSLRSVARGSSTMILVCITPPSDFSDITCFMWLKDTSNLDPLGHGF